MRTIEQHRDDIAELLSPVLARAADEVESVSLDEIVADGSAGQGFRILGRDVVSPVDLPRFDNSQMDGFALRHTDHGAVLRVVSAIAAGVVPQELAEGTTAPIMTGARMPIGADAVVPVESVGPGRFPEALTLDEIVAPEVREGTFVRRVGSDLRAGEPLAHAGDAVTPGLLGALAAASVRTVQVRRRPRVLIVSTGSELSGGDPGAGADVALIGDANGVSLRAAFTQVGVDARAVMVADDPVALVDALRRELETATDLVVTTGGISMGAFEVVREALELRGLTVTTVAMQPGGPQAYGPVDLDTATVPVVAFPGNPVSALISFEVFLRPIFAAACGLDPARPGSLVEAADAADSPVGKHQIRRGVVSDGVVRFVGGASSHLIAHYAEATHLVHVPVGVDRVEPGDTLTVWRIR
ncbi:gephyrin-like molybdotransferase Glp [Frondihabitans australicus]|uniref:Molybdopterin molybdenumtransferase n=1 Tax=Frondihabitans australicus TaxID=386892 RepID=A0A495IBE4_9MICO|nr:gephyrin-like molybdotransferase Glp [Frondihabitans australicus]RKR73323.1 molybdopterin molybdochelatase [Frondihabitans australicus]